MVSPKKSVIAAPARQGTANGPMTKDLAARLADFNDIPIMYEDDPETDMGEANLHAVSGHILRYGIEANLADQARYQVFSNLNLYYQPRFTTAYVSPDVMVTAPFEPGKKDVQSYHIGRDGPAPLQVAEILSEETWNQVDLNPDGKLYIYAMVGVDEYVVVDPSGRFLSQRLLLKRLQSDRTWKDEQDRDGGVTSRLGFRVIWDEDGQLRVIDARTGKHYARPNEAQAKAEELSQAQARVRELEAELARLKDQPALPKKRKKP